jgi:hypothetical protein
MGTVRVTKDGFIVFTGNHTEKTYDHMCVKAFKNESFFYVKVHVSDIRKGYKKRFNAANNAVYLKVNDGRELMFHFYLKNIDAFINILEPTVKIRKDPYLTYLNANKPMQWIDKFMSNYEYLQWRNEIAGRNYSDITQYPVLPWTFVADDDSATE